MLKLRCLTVFEFADLPCCLFVAYAAPPTVLLILRYVQPLVHPKLHQVPADIPQRNAGREQQQPASFFF